MNTRMMLATSLLAVAVAAPLSAVNNFSRSWDAGNDIPGNGAWQDDGRDGDGWNFVGSSSETPTPMVTTDPRYLDVGAFYPFATTPTGEIGNFQNVGSGDPTDAPASFELIFRPRDLTGNHILFEAGGNVDGSSIRLEGDQLIFRAQQGGDGNGIEVPHTLTAGDVNRFHHVVGTIDTASDTIELFVDGASAGTNTAGSGLSDWAGSNQSGLGGERSSSAGNPAGLTDFDGDIATVRLYQDTVFDQATVNDHVRLAETGLLIRYSFDNGLTGGGDVPNDAGMGFDGTLGGDAAISPTGRFGSGVELDGDNDFLTPGDVDFLDAAGQFSISLWFRRDTDQGSATNHGVNNVLFAQSSHAQNDNLELGTAGTDFRAYLDTVDTDTGQNIPSAVMDDLWHHVVLTYDQLRSDEMQLFLDGSLIHTDAQWGGPLDDSAASELVFGLARIDNQLWGDFDGFFDEIQLYTRVLSAVEVAILSRNATLIPEPTTLGLAALGLGGLLIRRRRRA